MSSTIGIPNSRISIHNADRSRATFVFRKAGPAFAVSLAILIALVAVLFGKYWPFSETEVREDLAEASDSTITIGHYHPTYFPPGCTLEGVEFHHGANQFKLITIDKLVVEGSYAGIVTKHVPRVTTVGARVFIPPFGENIKFHSQHSEIVLDELVANGTAVEFLSATALRKPLIFDIHEAVLHAVRWGSPLQYHLRFHNPSPPGEIAVDGKFGPWADGHPQDTPISGTYTFDHADLGVYGGIAGTLNSSGKFDGIFQRINVSATTDTPDFVVTSGGRKHPLTTRFEAYVDAMRGDTFLNRVEARLGRSVLLAHGSIAGSPGRKGKVADLHLTTRHGRIEDILGLFLTDPRSPMSGNLSLIAHAQIPSGDNSFLERVGLDAKFGIDDGSFKAETQKDVNELSAGARGQSKDDPEIVLTDLKGSVGLSGGLAQVADLDFGIPGAHARMHGSYNIVNHRVGLHGRMRVDTRISKTSSGFKALMLKVMDPIFRKKKQGEVVPVHILGTYEKPQLGLDIGQDQGRKP
jgi:hypothetical protein